MIFICVPLRIVNKLIDMGTQDPDAVVMGWMALECEQACEKGRKKGQRSGKDMLPIPSRFKQKLSNSSRTDLFLDLWMVCF